MSSLEEMIKFTYLSSNLMLEGFFDISQHLCTELNLGMAKTSRCTTLILKPIQNKC